MSGYPGDEYYAMSAESERRRAMTPDQPPSTEQALSEAERIAQRIRDEAFSLTPDGYHEADTVRIITEELTRLRASVASLQDVLGTLVQFQEEYAANAYEPGRMPGNNLYSVKQMVIVNAAHQLLHGTPVDVEAQRAAINARLDRASSGETSERGA